MSQRATLSTPGYGATLVFHHVLSLNCCFVSCDCKHRANSAAENEHLTTAHHCLSVCFSVCLSAPSGLAAAGLLLQRPTWLAPCHPCMPACQPGRPRLPASLRHHIKVHTAWSSWNVLKHLHISPPCGGPSIDRQTGSSSSGCSRQTGSCNPGSDR